MTVDDSFEVGIERDKLVRSSRLHWFHWLAIVASLVLTVGAWAFAQSQVDEKNEDRFLREVGQVVEWITERMQKYEDALWGGVGALQAQGGDISYEGWSEFANTLEIDVKYSGINGIGVIHHVSPARLPVYLAEQRRSRPDYRIHPAHEERERLTHPIENQLSG